MDILLRWLAGPYRGEIVVVAYLSSSFAIFAIWTRGSPELKIWPRQKFDGMNKTILASLPSSGAERSGV